MSLLLLYESLTLQPSSSKISQVEGDKFFCFDKRGAGIGGTMPGFEPRTPRLSSGRSLLSAGMAMTSVTVLIGDVNVTVEKRSSVKKKQRLNISMHKMNDSLQIFHTCRKNSVPVAYPC